MLFLDVLFYLTNFVEVNIFVMLNNAHIIDSFIFKVILYTIVDSFIFKVILYTDWRDLSRSLVFYYFPLKTKSVYKTNTECSLLGAIVKTISPQ